MFCVSQFRPLVADRRGSIAAQPPRAREHRRPFGRGLQSPLSGLPLERRSREGPQTRPAAGFLSSPLKLLFEARSIWRNGCARSSSPTASVCITRRRKAGCFRFALLAALEWPASAVRSLASRHLFVAQTRTCTVQNEAGAIGSTPTSCAPRKFVPTDPCNIEQEPDESQICPGSSGRETTTG